MKISHLRLPHRIWRMALPPSDSDSCTNYLMKPLPPQWSQGQWSPPVPRHQGQTSNVFTGIRVCSPRCSFQIWADIFDFILSEDFTDIKRVKWQSICDRHGVRVYAASCHRSYVDVMDWRLECSVSWLCSWCEMRRNTPLLRIGSRRSWMVWGS